MISELINTSEDVNYGISTQHTAQIMVQGITVITPMEEDAPLCFKPGKRVGAEGVEKGPVEPFSFVE